MRSPKRTSSPISRASHDDKWEPELHTPAKMMKGKCRSYVFYGRSATGKTTLASTFPGDVVVLDIRDEGTDSVSDVKGLKYMDVEDFEDFENMYWWLRKHKAIKFKTVVIDTCSQLQAMVVNEISGNNSKKKGLKPGDWGSMTKKEWGEVASILKEWFINYRDLTRLGYNVVFIAQDRVFNVEDEDDTDGQIQPEVGPGLSPSVAKTLNAAVNVIANTFIRSKMITKEVNGKKKKVEQIDYCLRIGPSSTYMTKVRKPKGEKPPAVIKDPTYEKILEVIFGDEE